MENIHYRLHEASSDRTQLFVPKQQYSAVSTHSKFRNTHRHSSATTTDSRNSSLNDKLWDEDYSDTEFGGLSHDVRPPTTRPDTRSVSVSEDEDALPAKQSRPRSQTLTSYLPFRSSPKSRDTSKSPERATPQKKAQREDQEEEVQFTATYTSDRDRVIKVAERNKGGLSSWFMGSSAPIALGPAVTSTTDEDVASQSLGNMYTTPIPSAKLRKRPQLETLESTMSTQSTPSKTPTTGGLFGSFFSPKKTDQTPQLPSALLDSDPLLSLDITTALFPSGKPDPFSPAAYNNLQMNADGILRKYQTQYKLHSKILHDLEAEKSAQEEELEEANIRAQCLKAQLEEMAARAQDQDSAIEQLMLQLAQEKQLRAAEKEVREKSIGLISSGREFTQEGTGELPRLQTRTQREAWRLSDEVSEFDGDSLGSAGSVFSRCRSPTSTIASEFEVASSLATNDSTLDVGQARVVSLPAASRIPTTARPKMEKQASTFQKMMSGMVDASNSRDNRELEEEAGCSNCRGEKADAAWGVVDVLKAENRGLKTQLEGLESGIDGALDLVNRLGLV